MRFRKWIQNDIRMYKRKILSFILFLVITFGIMIPGYVHYTARQFVGAYDVLYLSEHSPYDRVIIEVHYQEDAEPSNSSLSILAERIKEYTGKKVTLVKYPDIGTDEIPFFLKDDETSGIGNRILKNRSKYQTGWFSGNIVIYILYINPDSGKMNKHAAGTAYNADSIVLFKDNIPLPEIETPVLLHELGHLWGLEHSNRTEDIMNIHIDEYLLSHFFTKVPNDFSDDEKKLLIKKHSSWLIFPVKPYQPLYSVILNHASTMMTS